MPHGYMGKILHVDLSAEQVTTEEPDEDFYRAYFGGRNFIAHYLLKQLKPGIDPLSPENKLIFATGIVTGTPVPGSGRNSVGAKSPLTGAYGEAEVGGYWGTELKRAGFDAVVVHGRARKPAYLWVHDGQAEIRNAGHLWGKETGESHELICGELGDSRCRTAQIGPGGENLVRYACIMQDINRAAGRCGLGAVMGSKNLKAIAVRGREPISVADPDTLKAITKDFAQHHELYDDFTEMGTAGDVEGLDAAGSFPTRNFQAGSFENVESISGTVLHDRFTVGRATCYACPIHCKREVQVDEPWKWKVRRVYGGPEYETVGAFGSNCGVDDMAAICRANELCNAYSLDTISTGNTIAFAMECFERGMLTLQDTDGLDLRFGNADAMVQAVELIAHRQGFGDRLADGTALLADDLGEEALEFAMTAKGQEFPLHEPRVKHGLGLGYAVSPTGADHCHSFHDSGYTAETDTFEEARSLGILQPLPFDDLSSDKVRLFVYEVNWTSLPNCLVFCINLTMFFNRNRLCEIVKAVTGWNVSTWEMAKVGERSINLTRAFNVREGFSRADDRLPERLFQPLQRAPESTPINKESFERALTDYYGMMGWDEQGVPCRGKLQELGIKWVADAMDLT